MIYSDEMIEYYHNNGQMPNWAYYQQNGKTASENYREQHIEIQESVEMHRNQQTELRTNKAEIGEGISKQLDYQLSKTLNKVFDSLKKNWK